ncbi:MAG TPA: hypothetical protein VIM11_25340, partial [Tepidisphaeraceae bacterium]
LPTLPRRTGGGKSRAAAETVTHPNAIALANQWLSIGHVFVRIRINRNTPTTNVHAHPTTHKMTNGLGIDEPCVFFV